MKPYLSKHFPPKELNLAKITRLIGPANRAIAEYNGLLLGIVNPAIMLSPLTTNEAVLSSRIEGTQATLDEVLEYDAGIKEAKEPKKHEDIQEIVNYRKTLILGTEALKDGQITLYLIRSMHSMLMDSVRGHDKTPGSFRVYQNWIGLEKCPMEEATFVPPEPLLMLDYLKRWEQYLNEDEIDILVHLAIIHAQFEIIHPFIDGNGRIGRLLIPLFLYQKRVLDHPMFYLSEYLEQHRSEYYARLLNVSQKGDWNDWIIFFLEAITAQAYDNTIKVLAIKTLYERMKKDIPEITKSQYASSILDAIFHQPIMSSTSLLKRANMKRSVGNPLIKKLKEKEILKTIRPAKGSRPEFISFPELRAIIDGMHITREPRNTQNNK